MNIQQSFKKLIDDDKLSHGYIFFGNPDLNFIKKLSTTDSLDFLLIEPEEGKIGIDSIRRMNKFLWRTPLKSSRNTLVINQASSLTLPAQNAILKIAEEPPVHSLIFLLVKDYNVLVAPLASRFQKIFFPSISSIKKGNKKDSDYAQRFLKSDIRKKKTMIKSVTNDSGSSLENFMRSIMLELDKDPVQNLVALKELSYRWSLISRYNTNKKLQLEAWLQSLTGY